MDEQRVVVGGVDTHKDLHFAAVVDDHDHVLGNQCFPSTRHGYKQMLAWLRSFGELARIGVECTGTYGAGLLRYLQKAGVAVLDGKVCGGSLSFRLGDHYFALLNGYDTRYAKYSLGMLCCYLAMTEKIRRGASEAHLLWGRNPYKFKLLGVARDVANLDIYRSRWHYCRYRSRVLKNALRNIADRQKRTLLENEQRRGLLPSLAGGVVKILRKIKRSNFRPVR